MKHYPAGKIQEVNAGFKVSLLKGTESKTFASDKDAIKYTTKVMEKFTKECDVEAAVSFTRADGIRTYLLFNEVEKPFEMSDFRYVQTHSSYFNRSKLRSIIDVHNVSFKGIARVTGSGTPMSSNMSWVRIFLSTILFLGFGGLLLWYFVNPTTAMNNSSNLLNGTDVKNMTTIIIFGVLVGFGALGILLGIFKKLYYHKMIGSRKNRNDEIIHKIQRKDWGRFRRITRITDFVSLAILFIEIGLLVAAVAVLNSTIYFERYWLYWQSYVIFVWLSVMIAYLGILAGFAFVAQANVRQLEKALINTYVPEKLKWEYKVFLAPRKMRNDEEHHKLFMKYNEDIFEVFPYVEEHRVLRSTPKSVLKTFKEIKQPIGAAARKRKRTDRRTSNMAIKTYKQAHKENK